MSGHGRRESIDEPEMLSILDSGSKSYILDVSQPVLIYAHGRSVFEGRVQARKRITFD